MASGFPAWSRGDTQKVPLPQGGTFAFHPKGLSHFQPPECLSFAFSFDLLRISDLAA